MGAAETSGNGISSHESHLSQPEEILKKEKAATLTAFLGKEAPSHGHAPEMFPTSCERTCLKLQENPFQATNHSFAQTSI